MTVKNGTTHKASYPGMTGAESVDTFYVRDKLIEEANKSGDYALEQAFQDIPSEQLNQIIWTVESLYKKANFHKFNRKWQFIIRYIGMIQEMNDPPIHKIPMTEWTDEHWGRFFSIIDDEARTKPKASYF